MPATYSEKNKLLISAPLIMSIKRWVILSDATLTDQIVNRGDVSNGS